MEEDKIKRIAGKTTKIVLYSLLITGGVAIAATSPYAAKGILKCLKYAVKKAYYKRKQRIREEQIRNSFYYLKRNGLIKARMSGKQIYVSLTEEGKKIAKKCKFDELKIKKSKKWDKKWRILVFDIEEKDRSKREALRGKIKELGLFKLQKSIWIYPYDFENELTELQKFFRFQEGEAMYIVAEKIDNVELLKEYFKLK